MSGCLANESSLSVITPRTADLDALFDGAGLNQDPMFGRLHIRVVDCAGTPVEGAAFELTQSMGMPVGELIPNARSYLGAGTYFVHDIPPGATRVAASYSGMTFLAPTIPIAAGVTTSVVIRPGY